MNSRHLRLRDSSKTEEEVEREAELIAAERPEPEPMFGAPLFIRHIR